MDILQHVDVSIKICKLVLLNIGFLVYLTILGIVLAKSVIWLLLNFALFTLPPGKAYAYEIAVLSLCVSPSQIDCHII